jgi:hypothetical protein
LAKPRFCSLDDESAPDDDTAVLTVVRSTRAVRTRGGDDALVHAARARLATSSTGTEIRAKHRSRSDAGGGREIQVRGAAAGGCPGSVTTRSSR